MKRKWEEALIDAAAKDLRFHHAEGCTVIYFTRSEKNCKCGASAANKALNQIVKELATGIVLSDT